MAQEHQFSRHASHELLAPVEVIKSSAEVIEEIVKKGNKNLSSHLMRVNLSLIRMESAISTTKALVWLLKEDKLDLPKEECYPLAIAEGIIEILKKSSLFYSLRRRAYDYGRVRTWPKIGQAYWKLFSAKRLPVRITEKLPLSATETISSIEVPEPSLDHFKKLTDDTGMFQHATFTVPNREYGYTTDDNARAVIAMADYYFQYPEPEALELFHPA